MVLRVFVCRIFLVVAGCCLTLAEAQVSVPRPPSRPRSSSANFDAAAERQFLELANQERADVGLPPLVMNEGLRKAARGHSTGMAEHRELTHNLPGEPDLSQRLSANSESHFDQAGENVAYANSVAEAHNGLMHSPPHRENLLDPKYNAVGMGVVWSESTLYVTQDFGHVLPTYSGAKAEDLIAETVQHSRQVAHLNPMARIDNREAHESACAMAAADSVHVTAPSDHTALRYTTMQPDILPSNVAKMTLDPNVRSFAVGSCYSRTEHYPSGVYWVTLILY